MSPFDRPANSPTHPSVWPHTATLRLKLSPKSTLEAWSVAGTRVRESTSVVRVGRGDFCASTWPSYSNQALHAYASRRTRGASAFRPTHTICRSSPSAPLRGSPPPEDNEQATKAAEHGEQRGDGVDAVDPGDLARGGGAANHLNTRHNSQSKCGARRNARLSSRGAQGTAQSTGAAGLGVLRTASAARHGRGTYRTVSPHRLRGCWPRGAAPTHPHNLHRPQPPAGSPVKGSTSL